jgi:hypothetical protein
MQSTAPKPLSEILRLEDEAFEGEFYGYLIDKRVADQPLTEFEQISYLLLSMRPSIEMEGFVDLFYQLYSLQETAVVEDNLRRLGLVGLADLFAKAKNLYINGKPDITEEEYRAIDPFGEDERWRRFDEIGNEVMDAESEIFLLPNRVREWVKANMAASSQQE